MVDMLHVDPHNLKGRHIERAVEVLRAGGVIIYPTDTIYGLGCDITNKEAIDRIDPPRELVCRINDCGYR